MATVPAVLGTMRLGNARLGYNPTALAALRATRVRVYLDGELANHRVRREKMTIHDVVNETPSTCSFIADTTAPEVGQAVRVTINSDTPRVFFSGIVQTVSESYEVGKTTNLVWSCSATDDLIKLTRRLPFGTFTNVSATTVVQQLAASYAPGFSTTGVQASLPPVTIILDGSEGWQRALSQIAAQIGGYWYIEDGVIHLFESEATDAPDDIDGSSGRPLTEPAVTADQDLSQLRTRVYARGHGEATPSDIAAGETIIPIANAVMFNPVGGRAIAGTQRIAYTGVELGASGGSLVGPGAQPSAAPFVVPVAGSGVDSGTHRWAYTWVTASGETLPSPLAEMVVGTATAPAIAPTVFDNANVPSTSLSIGDSVQYAYSWSTALSVTDLTQETAMSPTASVTVVNVPGSGLPSAPVIYVGLSSDPRVRWVHIWRNVNGAGFVLMAVYPTSNQGVPNNASGEFNIDGGAYVFTHSAATVNRASLAGIAVGPSGTTSRKVYRTVAGGSQLKLLTTFADNTTTTVVDTVSDAGLGANAPTSDTSGLTQPSGQVNAGSTSLLTASGGPFASTGGWALVGSQAVRYTGISGNTLTGIPASGPGALLSTVRYGEHVDPSPALTGVTGLTSDLDRGTVVNLWVQRDDLVAQAAIAAIDGSDGIYEYLVSDERRGEPSLIAMADANLALYSQPIVTVRYATRDVKTKSGKPIVIDLPALGVSETLTIQDVTITDIDLYPATAPLFTVTAGSVRVSLESLLRGLLGEGAV